MDDATPPGWDDYEKLTHELLGRLASVADIVMTRLERDVTLQGKATENRIDIVWEFADSTGELIRVIVECRSYSRRITQQALHSWRSVIDDVSVPGLTTVGVMVTTKGYQSGAQQVAESYGVVICELRLPNEADLANRATQVNVTIRPRFTHLTDLDAKAVEQSGGATFVGQLGQFFLDYDDGSSMRMLDLLLLGELTPVTQPPAPAHRIVRSFDSPVTLRHLDQGVAGVMEISATLTEVDASPILLEISGKERVAWMLANTLNGSHVWFAEDGKIWQTPN